MSALGNKPLLYLITDRQKLTASLQGLEADGQQYDIRIERLTQLAARAAEVGIDLIQVREKDLTGRQILSLVEQIAQAARPLGARILVNDRYDVAIAAGADGVHLTTQSLPVKAVRKLAGDRFLIGASTHSIAEVREAEDGGADFVVFGPVFDTPSKRQFGPPVGLGALSNAVKQTSLPVLAIGGINLENFGSVLECGAAGIAAISMFAEIESLEEVVARIRAKHG